MISWSNETALLCIHKTPEPLRKYCLLLFLFLLSRHPVPAQEVAVMLDKMNVLFVGVDNPLHIVVSDVPTGRLVLTPSHGNISKDSSGGFLWRMCSFDSTRAWLILSDYTSGKPFDTVYFRVKLTPEPEFIVKNRIIGWIFHHDASENWKLQLISFEAEFIMKKSDPVVFVNQGRRFNGSVYEYMNRLVPGCHVIFSNFKWTVGCDPTVRRSDERLIFRIK